jgi:hypothetical protein
MNMKLMRIMLLAVLAIAAAQSIQSDQNLLEENDGRMNLGATVKNLKVMKAKELQNALADLDTDLETNTKWGGFKHRHHRHHKHHKHTPCVLYKTARSKAGGDQKKTWDVRKSVCQNVPYSSTLRTMFQTGCNYFGSYSYKEHLMSKKCFNGCKNKYTKNANEKNACVDGCNFVFCSLLSAQKRGCRYANPTWGGNDQALQAPGCGGPLVDPKTPEGQSVAFYAKHTSLAEDDLENDLEDEEETSWSKKAPAGKCAKVCYHDGCKGTWTNPIPSGQQWNRKGGYVGSGCCYGGFGKCDNCCPP